MVSAPASLATAPAAVEVEVEAEEEGDEAAAAAAAPASAANEPADCSFDKGSRLSIWVERRRESARAARESRRGGGGLSLLFERLAKILKECRHVFTFL